MAVVWCWGVCTIHTQYSFGITDLEVTSTLCRFGTVGGGDEDEWNIIGDCIGTHALMPYLDAIP